MKQKFTNLLVQMKYFLYVFKLPFSADKFLIGNNYMVCQSELTHQTKQIKQNLVEDYQIINKQLNIETKKQINIANAINKVLIPMIPRQYKQIQENSKQIDNYIQTQYLDVDEKIFAQVFTLTQENYIDIPQILQQKNQENQKIEKYFFEFNEQIQNMHLEPTQFCYSYKLFIINVNIPGLSFLIENIAGNKMKKLFITNYQNLINDYQKWQGLSLEQIIQIRKDRQIEKQQILMSESNE